MIREIIKIDEDKCNGCGICVPSCVEGALKIVNGKAKLVSEVYCDGLGACIGECPQGALTIERREANIFDEEAVAKRVSAGTAAQPAPIESGCCSGMALMDLLREETITVTDDPPAQSQLGHWPVQLMLVPPAAPFLKDTDIVVCADCVPFAVPDFHNRYLAGRAVLVGCPKLDNLSLYREKLTEIFRTASPKSITVLRMEVPCCGGIAGAVVEARDLTNPDMPVNVHTISIRGGIQKATY